MLSRKHHFSFYSICVLALVVQEFILCFSVRCRRLWRTLKVYCKIMHTEDYDIFLPTQINIIFYKILEKVMYFLICECKPELNTPRPKYYKIMYPFHFVLSVSVLILFIQYICHSNIAFCFSFGLLMSWMSFV